MGYSFQLAARVLLYASHRHDNTYHGLCYTSRGALAGTRNSSMGPLWRIDPTTHRTMSEHSYHGATSRSRSQAIKSLNAAVASPSSIPYPGSKEGNILFNKAVNTFYLWLYGVRHTKAHSYSEKRNPLPPLHVLLFPIMSKGSFICTITQTG